MKIKQADGTEIEVFTPQEVEEKTKGVAEAAAQKAIDEYKAANPDKSAEANKLKTDLDEANRKLQEALDAGGEDTPQIKRLRNERDEANKKLNETLTGVQKQIEDLKNGGVTKQKNDLLTVLSGNDAELKKKIEYEFDNYRPNDTTAEAIDERMKKAYQLATGVKPAPGPFDGLNGGSRGTNYVPKGERKVTDNEKAIGNVLGISDADREKFGKK